MNNIRRFGLTRKSAHDRGVRPIPRKAPVQDGSLASAWSSSVLVGVAVAYSAICASVTSTQFGGFGADVHQLMSSVIRFPRRPAFFLPTLVRLPRTPCISLPLNLLGARHTCNARRVTGCFVHMRLVTEMAGLQNAAKGWAVVGGGGGGRRRG